MAKEYTLICPECDSEEIDVIEYDYGIDSETGYKDHGMWGICLVCKYKADIDDFKVEIKDEPG